MAQHIAKHEIEPGVCPMCGKTLAEGDQEDQGGTHRWTDVSCPNCEWEGRQWDQIKFDGFTVTDPESGETQNVEASADEMQRICNTQCPTIDCMYGGFVGDCPIVKKIMRPSAY